MIYAALVKGLTPNARADIDRQLDWPLDEDKWGQTADAEAGQDAFMRIMSGGG